MSNEIRNQGSPTGTRAISKSQTAGFRPASDTALVETESSQAQIYFVLTVHRGKTHTLECGCVTNKPAKSKSKRKSNVLKTV